MFLLLDWWWLLENDNDLPGLLIIYILFCDNGDNPSLLYVYYLVWLLLYGYVLAN